MDPLEIYISCRKCKKDFVIKNLAKHAEKNRDCNQTYTQDQISDLKDLSKEVSKAKKRIKDAERYLKKKEELAEKYQQKKAQIAEKNKEKKEQIAEKYQEKKEQIAEKRRENYDKAKRRDDYQKKKMEIAETYRRHRVLLAIRYFRNRHGIKKKFDKEVRRKRYMKVMSKIAKERRELLEIKKSMAGEIFAQICNWIFLDIFRTFEDSHRDFALDRQEENREEIENEVIEEIFEEEKWIKTFDRKTFECVGWKKFHDSGIPFTCDELGQHLSQTWGHERWCLLHTSRSKLDDLVEESLDDKLNEEVDKEMLENANKELIREMKLTFESDYSTQWLPMIYSDIAERCRNKAFKTIYSKDQSDIYCKAKVAAMDLWQKCKYDSKLEKFLIEELEASGVYVWEKLYDLFQNDFKSTLEKEFGFFNIRVPNLMRSRNKERRDWAIKKLEKIQAFEKDSMDEDKKSLIEDSRNEIEIIYQEFEEEITDAHENYSVPYDVYFCFTDVVQLYPTFKSSGQNDPLFTSFFDEYDFWFFRIWHVLEIRRKNCECYTCSNDLHLTDECERVKRRRELECQFFTCHMCKNSRLFECYYEEDDDWHFKPKDNYGCCQQRSTDIPCLYRLIGLTKYRQ